MKKVAPKLLTLLALLGSTLAVSATVIVNQTNWPDTGTNYSILQTNQNLPYTVGWSSSKDSAYYGLSGSLFFTAPSSGGSLTLWNYFTDTNNLDTNDQVSLAVGQQIRTVATLTFSNVQPQAIVSTHRGFRWGIVYAGPLQLPFTNGTGSSIRQIGLLGYAQNMQMADFFNVAPLQILAFTNVNNDDGDSLFQTTSDADQVGGNGGGTTNDPGFGDNIPYTLILTVAHTATNTTTISTTVIGTGLTNGAITQTVTDTNYAYTNFDTFAIRPGASSVTAAGFQLTSFEVDVLPIVPAAPQITHIARLNAGTNIITWNASAGYSYSVLRTNALGTATAPSSSWPVLVTGYPVGGSLRTSLSWTDTTATASSSFYRISSP